MCSGSSLQVECFLPFRILCLSGGGRISKKAASVSVVNCVCCELCPVCFPIVCECGSVLL